MPNLEMPASNPDNNGAQQRVDAPPVPHEDIDSGFADLNAVAAKSVNTPAYPPAPPTAELTRTYSTEDRLNLADPRMEALVGNHDELVDAATRQSVAASGQPPQVQGPQSSKSGFFHNLAKRFDLGKSSKS